MLAKNIPSVQGFSWRPLPDIGGWFKPVCDTEVIESAGSNQRGCVQRHGENKKPKQVLQRAGLTDPQCLSCRMAWNINSCLNRLSCVPSCGLFSTLIFVTKVINEGWTFQTWDDCHQLIDQSVRCKNRRGCTVRACSPGEQQPGQLPDHQGEYAYRNTARKTQHRPMHTVALPAWLCTEAARGRGMVREGWLWGRWRKESGKRYWLWKELRRDRLWQRSMSSQRRKGDSPKTCPKLPSWISLQWSQRALSSGITKLQLSSCCSATEWPRNAEPFPLQELHLSGSL